MYKVVKYASVLPGDASSGCKERQLGCDEKAELQVCFDDGDGAAVCMHCLRVRANQGVWRTDTARMLKAS